MDGSCNTSAGDSNVPLDAEMYIMQNEDQDIHGRAQHDNDVPVSPPSVKNRNRNKCSMLLNNVSNYI